MLSAYLPPRHGVGRQAGTWVVLLAFSLLTLLSKHHTFITTCGASTTRPASSVDDERKVGAQQQREQPERAVSSPSLAPTPPGSGQESAPRVKGDLGARSRRNTISILRRPPVRESIQSPPLSPQREGSILLMYASLLLGKGGSRGRSASDSADTESAASDFVFWCLSRLSTRETALTIASLFTALHHFRIVRTTPQVRVIAAAEDAASEHAASTEAASQISASNEFVSGGTQAPREAAASGETAEAAERNTPESAAAEAVKAAGGSRLESADETIDKCPRETKKSKATGPLHRFASAEGLGKAGSTEEDPLEEKQLLCVTELKSKSLKNLLEVDGPKSRERDRRRFLTLSRFSKGSRRLPDSVKQQIVTSPRKTSWGAIKAFLCNKELCPETPYCARRKLTSSDNNRRWSALVAVVADAISKACDQCGRDNLVTQSAEEEEDKVTTKESRKSLIAGVSRPSSQAPDDTKNSSTVAAHEDVHQTRVARHNAEQTPVSNDATDEGSTMNVQSPRRTQSDSKAALAPGTGKKSRFRGKTRRGFSFAVKKGSAPRAVDPSSPSAKSDTALLRSHSTKRRSSSDRKSSSGSDTQRRSSGHGDRRRRWLGLKKSKAHLKPPLLALSSVESDAGKSERSAYGTLEKSVREELDGSGASSLMATGQQWWRESGEIKVKVILQRVTSALPCQPLLHAAVSSIVEQWTSSVVSSTAVDIPQLILRAAQLAEWKPISITRPRPETTSFRNNGYCRLSFFVISSEILDLAISKEFNSIVLKEAKHLRTAFATFEVPHREERDAVVKELSGYVAKMQALVAITETMEVSEGASAAVAKAHLELLKLAERVSHLEGTEPVVQYYLSSKQRTELVEERVKQMSAELEAEVAKNVYAPFRSFIHERLSRSAARQPLEAALEEVVLRFVEPEVHNIVAADVQAARYRLPEHSVPPVYHLVGLLSDEKVKRQIVAYHVHQVEHALPLSFYFSLGALLPRLAKEYRWLQDTANFGLQTLFSKERDSLNARVLVLVALAERFGLLHSVLARKLQRVVKVSKQLDFENDNKPALSYICEQLTSPETEDAEAMAAEISMRYEDPPGMSFEQAFLKSLAWTSSFSGSESAGSQQE